MKRDSMSKLSAGLFVLVLVLSGLVFVPAGLPAQGSSAPNIFVPVLSYPSGSPVTGADVTLTDVHTGAEIAAQYSTEWTAYVATNAPSGYYRVDVTHDDYFDEMDAYEFRYEGDNYTTDLVYVTGFPTKQYTINVTVRDYENKLLSGALVGFYSTAANEWVSKGVTNSAGYVAINMFTTTVPGDYDLVVVASGHETYVDDTILVNGNSAIPISLTKSTVVSAYVKAGSNPATNVVSYLINTDVSLPFVKRVLKSTSGAPSFDAYPGNFLLVIDAEGRQAHVESLTVSGDTPLGTIVLDPQVPQAESVAMTFGSNYASFDLSVNTNWSFDMAYPGLPYADMGSLRTQIDLAMGNGDGTVSPGEAQGFHDQLLNWGAEYVTSARLLTVNGTSYVSGVTISSFVMDLADGADTLTTSVQYAYGCTYSASGIDMGVSEYAAVAYANYDTSEVDYEYSIALVSGYERVSNSSGSFAISGYTTVVIDPMKVSGGPVAISIGIEASKDPVARAGVNSSSAAYAVKNTTTGVVKKYIVKVGSNVTFTAQDSSDPNGNPLDYTWDFKDGTQVTTHNATIVHNYASANALRVVDLTITDVVGLTDSTVVNVTCDSQVPVPVMSIKKGWTNQSDGAIWINQTDVVMLNAENSTDDAVSADDGLGLVDYVQYYYGDNESSGRISKVDQNVTHVYKKAGTFNLVLNVTDVVGHWKNTTMTVRVNDTTKPVVAFTVLNATGKTTLVENQTVVFNASGTTDNSELSVDEYQNLTYSWSFGDGKWLNGTGSYNVTHIYQRVGKLTMSLNVTDSAGNWNKLARVIDVGSSPRPKMMIDKVTYDPKNFTAGQGGLILVNMTNRGNDYSKNIVLNFYIVSDQDGSQKEIKGTYHIYNVTTGDLIDEAVGVAPGGKVYVEFECTFGNQGTYTIRVNATSDNQLAPSPSFTAGGSQALRVKQPGWVDWALWIGIIAVIVLVPLLLLMRSRMSKREKKGPRREKKSGGEEEL